MPAKAHQDTLAVTHTSAAVVTIKNSNSPSLIAGPADVMIRAASQPIHPHSFQLNLQVISLVYLTYAAFIELSLAAPPAPYFNAVDSLCCSLFVPPAVSPLPTATLARNLEFQRTSCRIEQSPNYDHNSLRLTGHDSVNGTQFDGNQSTLLPFDDFLHRYSHARPPYLPATCVFLTSAYW